MSVRPMADDTTGTCDWGGCDDHTVAERLDPQSSKWLGVCARHTGTQRRESPGRASCHHCGGGYALNVDGTLRLHTRGHWDRCPGSGQQPETMTSEEIR